MDSKSCEKDLRSYLKKKEQTLKALTLESAVPLLLSFYQEFSNYETIEQQGDGLLFRWDITNRRGGTRLEIELARRLRLIPEDPSGYLWPGRKISLQLQYKWDMDVIKFLNEKNQDLFACWEKYDAEDFARSITKSQTYEWFKTKVPSETTVATEDVLYRRYEDPISF